MLTDCDGRYPHGMRSVFRELVGIVVVMITVMLSASLDTRYSVFFRDLL